MVNVVLIGCILLLAIILIRITCMRTKRELFCGVDRDIVSSLLEEEKIRELRKARKLCNQSNRKPKGCAAKSDCEYYPSEAEKRENVFIPIRNYLNQKIDKKISRKNNKKISRKNNSTSLDPELI